MNLRHIIALTLLVLVSAKGFAWEEHPIMAKAALEDNPYWKTADSVMAKSLKTFLLETSAELAVFLEKQESWSRQNLPNYLHRPDALAFDANGGEEDIVNRFLYAIRLNPNIRLPLYLYTMPGAETGNSPIAELDQITTLPQRKGQYSATYVFLHEGEVVHPFSVLTGANSEPDYGFDLGLFEDNNTEYGSFYGFGEQPFGNPNLPYGSQAPFHMQFFHEAGIVYKFAPFMNNTFLDYRVHLFRDLSVFAFENQQEYWGWRFLGWSMHYAADATMPYHSKPLPGVSVLKMLWINLKAILGFPQATRNAVQLVSNKHTIIEGYQAQEIRRAFLANENDHPFFQALKNPEPHVPFSNDFLKDVAAKGAVDNARSFDRAIKRNFPSYMVKDPGVEVLDLPEFNTIAEQMRNERPEAAVELNQALAERFKSLSMTIISLFYSVVEEAGI